MKILIVGATGKIGSKILSNIDLKNYKIFTINKKKTLKKQKITSYKLDYYKDTKKLKKIIKKHKFKVVINLICFNHRQAMRDYYLYRNYISKYIFISSTSIYKKSIKKITEEAKKEKTKNIYIKGKIQSENFFINSAKNFPFIILRVCQIYDSENIPTLFKQRSYTVLKEIILNHKIYLIKNFNNKWKLLYSNDLAKIIVKIIKSKNKSLLRNVFNIVPDDSYSWEEIYNIYSKSFNVKFRKKILNLNNIKKLNPDIFHHLLLDKLKNSYFDNKKIFKIIKKPNFVNFEKKIKIFCKKQKNKILKASQDSDILKIFKLASN